MKRIAAMAALVITMLAVPAAGAMASTGGTSTGTSTSGTSTGGQGPGYGRPGPIQVACPLVHHKARTWVYRMRHRHGKLVRVRVACPFIPAKPVPVKPPAPRCRPEVLRFDMAAGSSTLTEVAGPTLSPTQEFTYDGDTYTIMSVNPGADSFTVFKDGFLFVNKGDAITDGTGVMCCTR
jgi:hypothetical protein